jgi:hypothetical protein
LNCPVQSSALGVNLSNLMLLEFNFHTQVIKQVGSLYFGTSETPNSCDSK